MPALAIPTASDLAHIPHLPVKPFVGHTLDLLADPIGWHSKCARELGPVYKVNLLGKWRVAFGGLDAMDFIYGDPNKCLSSHHGWDMLHAIFPGGLMLRDFENHRMHRRIMQAAFRKPVMDAYLARMDAVMPKMIDAWPTQRQFKIAPATKKLTLQMSAAVFMGFAPDDPRIARLNKAFIDEVNGGIGVIRVPLPFTRLRRGLKARAFLIDTFRQLIPERRANPGQDFFSQMCVAQDEDGHGWSEVEILDHFNFLMMAAHDTTASTISTMLWALASHPEWQHRVLAEIDGLPERPVTDETLNAMPVTTRVFREALRLVPPVPFIPRRTTQSFKWKGYAIPAGTWVSCLPAMVQRDPLIWTDPEAFDPDRFSPNRAEDRCHKHAWSPFGGGAHKCIGMHFAAMEAKLFLVHLLRRYSIELLQKKPVTWTYFPVPKPKGGLPVRLIPRMS